MEDIYQEQISFAGGVQPGTAADRVPDTAVASGVNTAFRFPGSGMTLLGCRPGLATVNSTALAVTTPGTNANLDFARLYNYDTGTALTNYLAVVNRDGRLYYKNPNNTFTSELTLPANWGYASGTKCFSAGDIQLDGTVFNNRLFLIKQSATKELRSFSGTTAVPWGLLPPAGTSVAITAVAGGVNLPAGTYDVVLTSYHSTTGGESNYSTTTTTLTTVAGERISVVITPTNAEATLYTHVRVYLRRQASQSRFYLVDSLGTGGNITMPAPSGSTTVYIDLTLDQITGQTTPAPLGNENAPPPSKTKYVCTFGRRLLVADDRNVYWSRQDRPDNFPPANFEPIETGEGDTITGIYPYSDEVAMVFTTTAIWGIFGNDPQTWTFKAIDHTIGCLSHLSIIEFNGNLGWWSDAYGPVVYNGAGISRLGERDLGREIYTSRLNLNRLPYVWAGHDSKYSRVIWAVPPAGTTRNAQLITYNYQLDKFESEQWDPMPAASLSLGFSSDGSQRLFLGSDRGHLFYFDEAIRIDGVPSGTVSGTLTGAATVSTITGTGFYTTGDGLTGRYVLITDSQNRPITKVEIASNTATVLTLATSIVGLLDGAQTYTYYIGSPDMRLTTRAYDMGRTFHKKRFDRLYVHASSPVIGSQNLFVTTRVDFDVRRLNPTALTVSSAWDASTSLWDASVWSGTESALKQRIPLFTPATNLQATFYQLIPNEDIMIHAIGILAGIRSERNYNV